MATTSDPHVENSFYFPSMRRWDGRARVTNNWNTLNKDHELFFRDGDCFVYLRNPGRSAKGSSFRLHTSYLAAKELHCLVDQSIVVPLVAPRGSSATAKKLTVRELYLPAQHGASKQDAIDVHLDTRNLFAWVYDIPLTGRSLGKAMVGLLRRINQLRPDQESENKANVLSYLASQHYTDFRECADHALAALHFAEVFEIKDLWIDAFAHCVGLHHKLHDSLEFTSLSDATSAMILKARLEMDVRLDRVSRSMINFFEQDLSGAFLGLHQAARDHFDRFRSFLHSYYIEIYGFWPPSSFESSLQAQRNLYHSMYSDFRSLYQYLVDITSTLSIADNKSASGGLCVFQTVRAFDTRHRYESLPHPLPRNPSIEPPEFSPGNFKDGRNSLNPLRRRRVEREMQRAASVKALTDASNRDWSVLSNQLVRRFEEFEIQTVTDDFETVSLVDGRKVRWILIYAVLQTLVSVSFAPKEVRDTDSLSYELCCHPPKVMPWGQSMVERAQAQEPKSRHGSTELEPDINYLQSNVSSLSLSSRALKKEKSKSERATSVKSLVRSASKKSDRPSLRGLLLGRSVSPPSTIVSRPAFCEILVPGYGNGLNEAKPMERSESSDSMATDDMDQERSYVSTSPSTLITRESSKSSGHSRSTDGDDDEGLTDMDHLSVNDEKTHTPGGNLKIRDANDEMHEIHFNTSTWDAVLDL